MWHRRTAKETARQEREGEIQPGSWLRSPQLTCSRLLNSSARASSLISWGKWGENRVTQWGTAGLGEYWGESQGGLGAFWGAGNLEAIGGAVVEADALAAVLEAVARGGDQGLGGQQAVQFFQAVRRNSGAVVF